MINDSVAAPSDTPPPPPEATPPPPAAEAPAAPAGQWVYTNQYGWVWMPYGQRYTYVPDDGYPSMYLYGPTLGWRWVSAPWVLGWGPAPYWGAYGRAHFYWYAHPGFAHRAPVYRAGPRWRGGFGGHGQSGGHFGHRH